MSQARRSYQFNTFSIIYGLENAISLSPLRGRKTSSGRGSGALPQHHDG